MNNYKEKIILEACVDTYENAKKFIENGADRIELCDNLSVGGTTPSYGMIKKCQDENIETFVMIRPKGDNFVYTHDEIEIMKNDIKMCKSLKVKGVVLGTLKSNNSIDYKKLKQLIEVAKPLEITFHKAIDEVNDILNEIPKLSEIGVNRILSSGKEDTAIEGAELLNKMISAAKKNNISIVVAGKITKKNLKYVFDLIPNLEYHGITII